MKRRVVGWLLLVVGVGLSVLLGMSSRTQWHYVWGGDTPGLGDRALGLCRGTVFYSSAGEPCWISEWSRHERERGFDWLFPGDPGGGWVELGLIAYETSWATGVLVRVVVWPLAAGALLSGWLMVLSGHRAARRARVGACVGCGYDLSGLGTGAVCPECGRGEMAKSKSRNGK